jgi:hypothetical protein
MHMSMSSMQSGMYRSMKLLLLVREFRGLAMRKNFRVRSRLVSIRAATLAFRALLPQQSLPRRPRLLSLMRAVRFEASEAIAWPRVSAAAQPSGFRFDPDKVKFSLSFHKKQESFHGSNVALRPPSRRLYVRPDTTMSQATQQCFTGLALVSAAG